MEEYEAAKCQAVPPIRSKGVISKTWGWLCLRYFSECTNYKQLDPRTQHVRRLILESTFDEPIKPGASRFFRDFPLSKMGAKEIRVLRDRKLAFPEAANSRIKAIRAVYRWACGEDEKNSEEIIPQNVARDISYLKSNNPSGWHTWTVSEVTQFESYYPIGTKARLALALLVFTGQRRSDVIRFGRQNVQGDTIKFTQFKGRKKKPRELELPILPVLQQIIDASSTGELIFLVNDLNRPFSDAGFGNWFHDRCIEAGVPGRAHGLRKTAATIAAENGATTHELMAIFGWMTLEMAERYTRAANQKILARHAMHRLMPPEQKRTESCPTAEPSGTFSEKSFDKSISNFGDGARGGNRTPTPCGTRF
jgi:integrase